EPADEVALARCLQTFERLADADLEGEPMPYPALRELAMERLAALDAARGQHQADGVVVSALLPMRAIPFKAVFVLGLGEGEFPAGSRLDPLDLRQARRRAGDVSSAERDRHVFLELLLSARKHLVLSWVARDDRTGEAREPSTVVRELQYLLRGYLSEPALAKLTVEHPVSPADAQYFPTVYGQTHAPVVESTSVEALRAARARALRQRLAHHVAGDLPEGEILLGALSHRARTELSDLLHLPAAPAAEAKASAEALDLPLAAIQRFLESPLQGAARYVLGLEEDAEALDAESEEPLDVDRMVRFQVLREAFWAGAGDEAATLAAYEALFARKTLAGQAPLGLFGERWRHEDHQMLAAWRQNLAHFALPPLGDWQTLRVGRAQEHAEVDRVLAPIALQIPTPTGELQPVHLHGPLLKLSPDGRIAVRNLSSAAAGEKHFLPGFITLVALAALERVPGQTFGVIVNPTRAETPDHLARKYRVPPPHLARQWLTDVVQDLLYEPHDYRLPIEVVLRWRADRDERGPGARPFMPRSDRNSSKYGPVRDPERFDLPDLDRAEAIVHRRLWPWFASEIPRGGRR
ncbi:MAG: exodeoxyribonuclease V subunit gamma, partial [Myxococcales bacterium]|nr:exodeoxyribonuclease V subunit gamma [Myxococcales bacterium]